MNEGSKSFRRAGAPSKGYKKKLLRSVVTDPDIEEYLRNHRELNASDIFRWAINSMMPKGDTRIMLDKVEREASDLKIQLKMKELMVQELKNKLEYEESIKLDLRLEEDCGAWYLKDLIHSKKIYGWHNDIRGGFTVLNPQSNEIFSKYRLFFNYEYLCKNMPLDEKERMKEMPLEFYKKLKPIIKDSDIKEQIKSKMRPEYIKPVVFINDKEEGEE